MSGDAEKLPAVVVFSGGTDSACAAAMLRGAHRLHGITFAYGQRAGAEVAAARGLAGAVGLEEHRVVDIGFMRELYGSASVLTHPGAPIPEKFDYSIVVPARNAVFLAVASAWAYTLGASVVAYGAHTGDGRYPDCRPEFAKMMEGAVREGEIDGIRAGVRKELRVWSPYMDGLSKADLLRKGHAAIGGALFRTWSCYGAGEGAAHCGRCESCNNRRGAFAEAGIEDLTRYAA